MSQFSTFSNDDDSSDFPEDPIRSDEEVWEEDESLEAESMPPVHRIYCRYDDTKRESRDDRLERLQAFLAEEQASGRGRFVAPDNENPLFAYEGIVLGCDETFHPQRSVYVSSCSSIRPDDYDCRKDCPLEDPSKCCRVIAPCEYLLLRPKKADSPNLCRMFPKDEVLALKVRLIGCPELPEGGRAAITDLVWVPACDAQPFEREVVVEFPTREDQSGHVGKLRPDNLLTSAFLSSLPPVSVEARTTLKGWFDYLDWRERLLAVNARGVRYLHAEEKADGTRSFTVILDGTAEGTSPPRWLEREELEAIPLEMSFEPWLYRELDDKTMREKKPGRAIPLGEGKCILIARDRAGVPIPPDCPVENPVLAEVRFSAEAGETPWSKRPTRPIPEEGFLRVCRSGDRSLVNRMQSVLHQFAINGSNAAPFLSSYLFDITQARLPKVSKKIDSFLNPHLNEAQKRAVQIMLDAPDIALVQGPPGTGKTTVIAEAIWQFARMDKTVLLASQSIAAVENALDRLEPMPEIRICLRRKRWAQRDEDVPFSDESVLEDYYETLGKKAHDIVAKFDQGGHRAEQLRKIAEELAPVANRLAEEEHDIDESNARAIKKNAVVQEATVRMEAAQTAARAKGVSERLVNVLPTLGVGDIGDWARDVPETILAPLAEALRRAEGVLKRWGMRIWTDIGEDEPHRPSDIRLRALAAAAERVRRFADVGIPTLLNCIRGWRESTGEKLMDDESVRQLQDDRRKLDDIERKRDEADAAGDNDAYKRFQEESRILRRAIRKAMADAKTPLNAFREWFSNPMADGRTLADAIDAANGNRAAVLSLVEEFEPFATQFRDAVTRELSATTESMRTAVAGLPTDDGAETALHRARRDLQEEETLAAEARIRHQTFLENIANPILDRLRVIDETAPDIPAQALEWCRNQVAEWNRKTDDDRQKHPWLEPVFREWDHLTSHPTPEDREKILPLYLAYCNVVGITCTASEKLLENLPSRFDVVIVDEVSKATPPELIAPMMRGAKTILVGDHRQLPPLFGEREPLSLLEIAQKEEEDDTIPDELKIVSHNFRKYQDMVEASLFKRHFEQADPRLKCSLWVQHRMHPDIMKVINVFYEGRLQCGIPQQDVDRVRDHGIPAGTIPWITPEKHAFWIDSTKDPMDRLFPEETAGTSKQNVLEARLIVRVLKDLDAALEKRSRTGEAAQKKTVGVISFYGKQKGLLNREVKNLGLRNLSCNVETVDRFQGQESDYVLVSMTRNVPFARKGASSRSFIARFERINVAFSRAKELLLVFGAKDFFQKQPVNLPSLDGSTPPRKVPVYAQITEMLERNGALIPSREVISRREWASMPPTPGRPNLGHGFPPSRPGRPGHFFPHGGRSPRAADESHRLGNNRRPHHS